MSQKDTIDKFKKPGERERKELGILFHTKRYISYYAAVPFLNLPFTPNQITVLANLVQIVGIAMIAFWPGQLRLLGLFVFYLGDILDFVDGNIARYRSQCSQTGVFLDQLGHVIVAPLFFASIGIAAFLDTERIEFMLVALLLGIGPAIVSFQLVAINQFIPMVEDAAEKGAEIKDSSLVHRIVKKLISGIFHFKAELLLCAILFNRVPELALLLGLYFPVRIFLQALLDRKLIESCNDSSKTAV